MVKTYVTDFRLRCYFCKKCDLHIQYYGNDPVVGECPCCKKPISELHLESDAIIKQDKKVDYLVTK